MSNFQFFKIFTFSAPRGGGGQSDTYPANNDYLYLFYPVNVAESSISSIIVIRSINIYGLNWRP